MGLSSCKQEIKVDKTQGKAKEELKVGLSPYDLSEEGIDIIRALNLENRANIISFKAPKASKYVKANIYTLEKDGTWKLIDGIHSVIENKTYRDDEDFNYTFSMIISNDYYMEEMTINMGNSMHSTRLSQEDYTIDTSKYEGDYALSSHFLDDFQKIKLNKEIPVAIMIQSTSTDIGEYSLKSFFSTEDFEDMDNVQAVTLTFSDKIE